MSFTEEPRESKQDRDTAVVFLFRVLFHQYFCPEEEVKDDKKPFVHPGYFLGWFDKKNDLMDKEEICAAAKVDVETWDFVKTLIDNGAAVQAVNPVWANVTMSHRPPPKHELERVSVHLVLTYKDGTIVPFQGFAVEEMLESDPHFHDMHAVTIAQRNANAFIQHLQEMGLDGVYKRGANYRGGTPNDPYDVFCGLVVNNLTALAPEYQEPVKNYLRLFQGLLRPVVPPTVKAAIAAQKQKPAQAAPDSKAQGGWDVG